MNYTSSAINEVSDEIAVIDAAELISERYNDCEFVLDTWMFSYHNQKNKELQQRMTKEIQKNLHSTLYTTKEVKGVALIHENNKYSHQQL